MNNLINLFSPVKFYNSLQDKKLGVYILLIIVIYLISYFLWGNLLGPIYDNNYAFFFYNDRHVNIFFSFCVDLLMIFSLSVIIYYISRIFKLKASYIEILFIAVSVELISIVIMGIQIILIITLEDIPSIQTFDFAHDLLQAIYLFVGLKTIQKISFLKTAILLPLIIIIVLIFISIFTFFKYLLYPNTEQIGAQYLNQMDTIKAIEIFKHATIKYPKKDSYHYFLGESYRQHLMLKKQTEVDKYYMMAEKAYSNTLTVNPKNLKAKIGLGKLYYYSANYYKALIIFKEVSKSYYSDDIIKKIGEIYLKLNNIDEAKAYFIKLKVTFPHDKLNKTFFIKVKNKITFSNGSAGEIISKIIWKINDPILYNGRINNLNHARMIIKDIYYAIVLLRQNFLRDKSNNSVTNFKKLLIEKLNSKNGLQNYGIIIISLQIKIP